MLESPAAYWSFVLLAGGRKPKTATELAKRCGLAPAEVERALARLAALKLTRRSKDGWSSPLADSFVILPRNYKGYARGQARLKGYWDAMVAARGGDLFDLGALARLPTALALEAIAAFRSTIATAMARYQDEDSGEAPFFLVQARVRRVLPA